MSSSGDRPPPKKGPHAPPPGHDPNKTKTKQKNTTTTVAPPPPPAGGSQATWQAILGYIIDLGVPNTAAAMAFAKHAAQAGWSTGEMKYYLYRTQFFRNEFPGIFHNGQLLMSPREYTATWHKYAAVAAQAGVKITKDQFGYAIGHNIDFQNWAQRVQAVGILKSNAEDFKIFQTFAGPKGPKTQKQLLDFIMREGNPDWYHQWSQAAVGVAAANYGMSLGADITRAQIRQLVAQDPNALAEAQSGKYLAQQMAKWQKIAQNANDLTTYGYGPKLNAGDLAQLEYGGPRAGQIQYLVDQASKAASSQMKTSGLSLNSALETKLGSPATQTTENESSKSMFSRP